MTAGRGGGIPTRPEKVAEVADRLRKRRREALVERIAHMIGQETYNHAPINYTIAEKAIALVEAAVRRSPNDF